MQRLQEAESRNEELSASVSQGMHPTACEPPSPLRLTTILSTVCEPLFSSPPLSPHPLGAATKPLLRQLENLQAIHSTQAANWEMVEGSLTERLGASTTWHGGVELCNACSVVLFHCMPASLTPTLSSPHSHTPLTPTLTPHSYTHPSIPPSPLTPILASTLTLTLTPTLNPHSRTHPSLPHSSLTLTHSSHSHPHSHPHPNLTPPGIAQAHASEAMEKERESAEKEMALQSRISSLEAQAKGLRQDKTKQEALLEAERAKLTAMEEASQKWVMTPVDGLASCTAALGAAFCQCKWCPFSLRPLCVCRAVLKLESVKATHVAALDQLRKEKVSLSLPMQLNIQLCAPRPPRVWGSSACLT